METYRDILCLLGSYKGLKQLILTGKKETKFCLLGAYKGSYFIHVSFQIHLTDKIIFYAYGLGKFQER